ncbi:MAG: glycosyltransferase family 2 protein [Winogradskyella sp.]
MNFSLVICTYMRPQPLLSLLNSVAYQTVYPDEILIIDGSRDNDSRLVVENKAFKNVIYYQVNDQNRGLTKQRNFGIKKVNKNSEIICFLDDDTVLDKHYFQELLITYQKYPEALGVGGYITNEVKWQRKTLPLSSKKYYFEDWERLEPLRFRIRKLFGLLPDKPPGYFPEFSHGRSVSFIPPTGKIYKVQQLMGGVSSFKKEIFRNIKFSSYFEGYGLYEDADFTLRLSKLGQLYLNTAAQLEHHHSGSGRPNQFKYGKMVARNGWYVWRVAYPKPRLKNKLKWHLTFIILTNLRFLNVLSTEKRMSSLSEALGRCFGWLTLFINKPRLR